MFKQTYPRTLASIDAIMRDVKAELERLKLPRKNLVHALLLTEECTAALIENVSQRSDEPVEVAVRKRFGDISVRITVAGEECDPTLEVPLGDGTDQQDRDVQAVLRHRILRAYDSDLSHSYKSNRNVVTLTVKKNARKTLRFTLAAFVLAIIVGMALQLIGNEALITGLDANLLTPVRTMFLNALKMIMVPVVFFSLVNCISDLSNVSELGRIGGKTTAFYLFTCVCAICIGIGVFYLIHPGAPVAEMPQADATSLSQMEEVSILSIIVNIVPDNIASAVLEADMLQIIFIAVLCGIAVSVIGERGKILKEIFDACNELFLRITRMIISVVPIATFCAVTSLVATTGVGMLLSLVGVVGTFVLGLLILLVVYGLLILVLTRESPITFYRKYASCMLLAFTLSSRNATMPTTIQYCVNKLGVSPKVASFAIPLGSTINMDGSCVYLAVCSLFLAQMYGVDISGGTLLTLAISVMMLAIGAPGVTGAAFICLSTLVVQLGIPVESVTILMGIDQLLSMLRTTGNTTGDAVGAVVVAKTEGFSTRRCTATSPCSVVRMRSALLAWLRATGGVRKPCIQCENPVVGVFAGGLDVRSGVTMEQPGRLARPHGGAESALASGASRFLLEPCDVRPFVGRDVRRFNHGDRFEFPHAARFQVARVRERGADLRAVGVVEHVLDLHVADVRVLVVGERAGDIGSVRVRRVERLLGDGVVLSGRGFLRGLLGRSFRRCACRAGARCRILDFRRFASEQHAGEYACSRDCAHLPCNAHVISYPCDGGRIRPLACDDRSSHGRFH